MTTNFYDVLKPMYYCSMVVSLTPFKISSEGVKNSTLAVLWCIVFTGVCGSISFIVRTELKLQGNGFVLEITDFVQVWLGLINLIVTGILSCTYKNQVNRPIIISANISTYLSIFVLDIAHN